MKKILVIEDNVEVRENICEILELSDYEVVSAVNGKEGVEMAMNEDPDLILCDVMMPELDGFGVLKILNKKPETNGIPFVFLTAKAEKTDFRKGMGLGADDYITKPFDDTELLEAIDMRIKKSSMIKQSFDKTETGLQRFFSEARAREELEKLSVNREIRKYNKKDKIYEETGVARWLFFIISGKVKTYKSNEFGKDLITHIYSEGDFFGYFPLLDDSPYIDNAIALEAAEVRLIPKDDFKLLLFNNRDFSAQFIKMLANEVNTTEQKLIELAYSSVRRKVANAILEFASAVNTEDEESVLSISATRDDLASTAGTAKETLIRTLSDFKEEKLIEIDGSTIVIIDYKSLKAMPQ
ncbi:MAG: response regulator [Saprospiraceae bacterium]|nr:response regulator [Bacteroidia bacterium]NNK88987.1 response regulator [Saprospiraceae bacterium]